MQEIIFGEDYRIYCLMESHEDRKFVGKNLSKMFYDADIKIYNSSIYDWYFMIEGESKCIHFGWSANWAVFVSCLTRESNLIDLR